MAVGYWPLSSPVSRDYGCLNRRLLSAQTQEAIEIMSSTFINYAEVVLTPDGFPIRMVTPGTWFQPADSTEAYPFDFSFDGQSWRKANVGLAFPVPEGYNSIWLRARDGIGQTIGYYYGNQPVTDSRLSIVRDPNHYQLFNYQVAQTLGKPFTKAKILANANVLFPGLGTSTADPDHRSAGSSYSYRKSICVTNSDPASDLEIYSVPASANTFVINSDGTVGVELDECVRAATAFFRQAWFQECCDDLIVANETSSDINCRIYELFYPVSVAPAISS
jgi:hypothetical protein